MPDHWGGLLRWCQQHLNALLQRVKVGEGLPELLLLRLWVVQGDPRWHRGRLSVPCCRGIWITQGAGGGGLGRRGGAVLSNTLDFLE